MNNQEKIQDLIEKRVEASLGGGEKRIEALRQKEKYTARERIQIILDDGSFEEFDMFVQHRSHNLGIDKEHYLAELTFKNRGFTRLCC